MCRLQAICVLLFIAISCQSSGQTGYLFVKRGIKKVLTLLPGDDIHARLKNGGYVKGTINSFQNDTIFVNGKPVDAKTIVMIYKKPLPKKRLPDTKTMLLIGAGAGLTTVGLAASGQQDWDDAAITGATIGFGPLLLKHYGLKLLRLFVKKKYRVGKKYRVTVMDLSIPGLR